MPFPSAPVPARDRRIATAMQRLLLHGFAAPSPMAAAVVLGQVVADHLGTERNAVFFFTGASREQIEVATVGGDEELSRAVARSVRTVANRPEDSPGWLRARSSVAVEAVADTRQALVRAGGVVRTLRLGAYLAVPLIGPDGTTGHMLCGMTAPRPWTAEQSEDAMRLALAGAAVIEAARRGLAERRARRRLEYRASHDLLTGLLNRDAYHRHLQQAAADAAADRPLAVLLIDLDRFKTINDTHGHHAGDRLLVAAARRLRSCLRSADVAGRIGGDEFAVTVSDAPDAEAVATAAQRVAERLNAPYRLGGAQVPAAASVGVALCPAHARDHETLLRCADSAMYRAKRAGTRIAFYAPEQPAMRLAVLRRAGSGWPSG